MAFQLEVINLRDSIPVTSLPQFVPGMTPLTLVIKGADFSSAEQVLINEGPVPEFMIIDHQTIWAQMPSSINSISSVEVVSASFTKNNLSAKVTFALGNKTNKVSGLLKLTQLFTKWVLQTPGSDIQNPTRGGGLQQIAGKIVTSKDMKVVYATITAAIKTTTNQIAAAQANVAGLPLNEKLLDAQMIGLTTYEAQMEARVRVQLTNMTGVDALTALQL